MDRINFNLKGNIMIIGNEYLKKEQARIEAKAALFDEMVKALKHHCECHRIECNDSPDGRIEPDCDHCDTLVLLNKAKAIK